IEQHETELCFQILHRGEDRRLGAAEFFRRRLKTALGHNSVETLELEQSDALDHRVSLLRLSIFHSIYQISDPPSRARNNPSWMIRYARHCHKRVRRTRRARHRGAS